MMTKLASCFLAFSVLTACQSTNHTAESRPAAAKRPNLQQRMLAQNSETAGVAAEPAPPAEGPEDVPVEGTIDPNRNPGLLPTPLLRGNAAGGL